MNVCLDNSNFAAVDGAVTVVVPTFNHGNYIVDALDSVFAQTRAPERVLVLDDASTDDTANVVQPYLGRSPHIDYVRMPQNRGVIEMLNIGLARVTTEYVVFLAADDMLDPSAMEKCVGTLRSHPHAPLCGVLARYVDDAKRPIPTPALFNFGDRPRYLPPAECLQWLYRHGALFGGNGAMYRTEWLRRLGGFPSELRSFCDGFRIQELALTGGVCLVPEVLASWRQSAAAYAAKNRSDPVAALAIADAVDAQLRRNASPFPAGYAGRLRGRLCFAAALAAVGQVPVERVVLRRALSAYPSIVAGLIALLARPAGGSVAKAALAVLLKPFDIPRALRPRSTPRT